MNDGLEPKSGLIGTIIQGLVIFAAFAAVSVLFVMLLRPLSQPNAGGGMMASPDAAAKAATADSAPAIDAQPQSPQPLPAGPKVAVLVTEIGADEAMGVTSIEKLPAPIGLAFLPAEPASRALARKARLDGHEVWIGLPMQPKGWPKISPGQNTLLVNDPSPVTAQKLEWALSRIDRPTGAYTMMGSAFTADAAAMKPVAAAIRKHDLVLLDARSVSATVAAKTVIEAGGRALTNNMFIDADASPAAINAALKNLAAQAKTRGHAVGIARAIPATVALIPGWAEGLEAQGIALVPPSRLAAE